MNNKRYFFFAALMIYDNETMCNQNFGSSWLGFPTIKQVREAAKEHYPETSFKAIIILSICELSEEDYKTFWSDN